MRYLITGNTGFKGTWFTLYLKELGHEVYGLALPPQDYSFYSLINARTLVSDQIFVDIRENNNRMSDYLEKVQPDFLVHFAAQPLVWESYKKPRVTLETNVMGTFNVLESLSKNNSLKAVAVITTDKVYKNVEKIHGYVEEDSLGGHDPYSASKAMADILTQSFALSYPKHKIFIARAGNVIGGGDFSKDRLIPDIYRAVESGNKLIVRNANSIRPWQHVFDCLNGYQSLLSGYKNQTSSSVWNFGPDPGSFRTVSDVLNYTSGFFGKKISWLHDQSNKIHETSHLTLDSSKAKKELGWKGALNFEDTLKITFDWYRALEGKKSMLEVSQIQIRDFLKNI